MDTYTVIMDLAGGTYVSQVMADNVEAALSEWAVKLEVKEIQGLGENLKKRIILELEAYPEIYNPVLLDELSNVWSRGLSVFGRSMQLTLVKTATS